jgi:hypothetical protein
VARALISLIGVALFGDSSGTGRARTIVVFVATPASRAARKPREAVCDRAHARRGRTPRYERRRAAVGCVVPIQLSERVVGWVAVDVARATGAPPAGLAELHQAGGGAAGCAGAEPGI